MSKVTLWFFFCARAHTRQYHILCFDEPIDIADIHLKQLHHTFGDIRGEPRLLEMFIWSEKKWVISFAEGDIPTQKRLFNPFVLFIYLLKQPTVTLAYRPDICSVFGQLFLDTEDGLAHGQVNFPQPIKLGTDL